MINFLKPPQEKLNSLLECYQTGRYVDAEKLSVSIIKEFPKHPFAWKVLVAVLIQMGKKSESLVVCQKNVQLNPQDAEALNNLGVLLQEVQGRLKEAEESYKKAITLKPNYAECYYNLGNTLKKQGRLDEAETNYKKAIALKPDYAECHNNLGDTLQARGKLDEAETNYKKAIALKPDYAEAHRHLTILKKFDIQDEQYSKMQELYLDKNISEDQRCHINFGLAKACEDLGDIEKAFQHYREGNELRKKLLNYNINQDIKLFRQIKYTYPQIKQNSVKADKLLKNLIPIFIVGLPRSGTTLVEQIISSHPKVTGAGELNFAAQFGSMIAQGLSDLNPNSLINFRERYLSKLQSVSKGNLIVTDKMPQNFRYIGLLAAAFPEAKIVHVKRNPAAVCWANYKQYFVVKDIGYCYAIDDLISYHKLYENLMVFWTNSLSKKIYNLDYEKLTVNQESETRQLIDYLELDWDEKCLSPQNNKRNVATASNVQIRKKVYRGSSEQWKKYQPFLNGAFDSLLSS
jgi:tetratricopeptide (TPR) repeat protein